MLDIYRLGSVVISIHPAEGDSVTHKVMGEHTMSLTASLASPFTFMVGDYCFFDGQKFTLNQPPKVEKTATNQFVYSLTLEGLEYELRKVSMLYYTYNLDYVGGADFSLMGDATLLARVIVENLNRVQSGWTVGNVIASDVRNLTFSNNNLLEAITKIAEEWATEYWIGADKTVNIGKRGDILPINFAYGQGNGLYSITRDNVSSKDIVTRLYAFGSNQNLIKGYRNNATRLQLASGYIEKNTAVYGVIESTETFEEIKPERTGTISALGATTLEFIDSSMDFDLNATDGNGNTLYLIPGTTAKVHFQTGDLAGYELELSSYNHTTKKFTLIKFTNEQAYELPNDTLKPRVGDKYILLDIYMPQSYVDDAEARLLVKAQESINQNSEPQVTYSCTVDPLWVEQYGFTFKEGDYVHISDTQLGIDRDIRIVTVSQNIVYPNKYTLELADTVEPSLTAQILTTLEATDIVLKQNKLTDPARARRSWKVNDELKNAIFDQDGYFDSTNLAPLSIETSMLSVGNKGMQFYTDCYFQANYQGNANNVLVGNGVLTHFTIADSVKTWTITGLTSTIPDSNLRYLYIACLKVGTTGQVVISANQMDIDQGSYYYFFGGVISSVIDNARQISLLFGFTSINGRFIKTGRIQSGGGACYFDMDSEEIGGNIKFKSGTVYKDVGTEITTAQTAANAANALLFDIASDSKLTPNEKNSVLKEWQTINAEVAEVESAADNLNLSYDDYYDAYYALSAYITPLLASMATTSTIDSATFNGIFSTYYTQKLNLLNTISATINLTASAALNQANAVFPKDDSLMAHWSFDDDDSDLIRDSSGNGNTLQSYGGSSKVADGVSGSARQFDGTGYLLADSTKFRLPAFSFSVWFNSPGMAAGQTEGGIWANTFFCRLFQQPNGTISWWLCDGASWYDVYSTKTLFGSWHHAACIFDGTTMYLYIDGILHAYRTATLQYHSNEFFVGYDPNDVPYHFNGLLDEARFYSRALNASEVLGLYKYITKGKAQAVDLETAYLKKALEGNTSIEGGLILSDIILLGSEGNNIAGICGVGTQDSEVRLWAGQTFANRATAPFRVLQSGEVFARRRIELRDENDVGLAGICGSNASGDGDIRFWAGDSYANRATAPFRVDKNGVVVMTKAQLSSANSGKRIVIDSSTNSLQFFNSNGEDAAKLDELVDTDSVKSSVMTFNSYRLGVNTATTTIKPDRFRIDYNNGLYAEMTANSIHLDYFYMPKTSGGNNLKALYISDDGIFRRAT